MEIEHSKKSSERVTIITRSNSKDNKELVKVEDKVKDESESYNAVASKSSKRSNSPPRKSGRKESNSPMKSEQNTSSPVITKAIDMNDDKSGTK
jgi:hypothetical protein